jgi:hypothetical protein
MTRRLKTRSGKMTYFLIGFFLIAIAHLTIKCEDFTEPPDDNNEIVIDETLVNDAVKAVETAFITGDAENVLEYLSVEGLETYSDLITGSSEEDLKAFGEGIKNRELSVISEKYAEFDFPVDGIKYSIAFTVDEEGNWKIMRL